MNFPFQTVSASETSTNLLAELLSRLGSFVARFDDAIFAVQTSDSLFEQAVGGCIPLLIFYFGLKYTPFRKMTMPVVRWVDRKLDLVADWLVRKTHR